MERYETQRSAGNEVMGSVIAFIAGSCFVFLILAVLENRGKLRFIRKFGNPQIGGRASPPTGITTTGQTPREPCGLPRQLKNYRRLIQQQKQDNPPKKFSDPDE